MNSAPFPPSNPKVPLPPWPLLLLSGLIFLPELLLQAADHGLIGNLRWRGMAYTYGAFWSGLLFDWTPNYTAQPATMFLSYSFLHAGLGHMIGNAITLFWLGQIALDHLSPPRFFVLYVVSTLGGALGFGLLSSIPAPMVGASGAIFGLAGAWIIWAWQDQPNIRVGRLYVLKMIALLAGLNLAIWILQNGNLAWETHLGGFIAGALAALALQRRDPAHARPHHTENISD